MKYVYIIYQFCIALPIYLVATILTALITIVLFPWRNSRFLHTIQSIWARLFCYLLFIPVTIEGKENLQPEQSYVFVSNHQSMVDVFVIYGWLPSVFKWLMKQELRKIPLVGLACLAAGHIFVNRKNTKSALESLYKVKSRLTNGVSTVIFPEGTRTPNGEVGRFKRGAFQVAMDVGLPIVPISLSGCYEAMNRHSLYVTRHALRMRIGKPMMMTDFSDSTEAIEAVRTAVVEGMGK